MAYFEEEHPRHPAGSPGGRGGEWRPKISGWATAVLERMGHGPRAELEYTLQHGIAVDQVDIVGGESSQVRIVDFELPDGSTRRLIRKRVESPGVAHTEANMSLIGEAVGAPILPVVVDRSNPRVIWTPLADGKSAMELLATSYHGNQATWAEIYKENEELYFEAIKSQQYNIGLAGLITVVQDTDEGRLLGLFDMLVQNGDRHEGNWLITNTGIVGIDHSHGNTSEISDTEYTHWTDSPFAHHFMWGDRETPEGKGGYAYMGLADNDMHPDDLALIGRRIAALYEPGGPLENGPVAGSPMLREVFESRLAILAARAKGTRRRLS